MVCRAENVLVKLVLDRNTAVGGKKQTNKKPLPSPCRNGKNFKNHLSIENTKVGAKLTISPSYEELV